MGIGQGLAVGGQPGGAVGEEVPHRLLAQVQVEHGDRRPPCSRAVAMWMARVDLPAPPFSLPTTMTWARTWMLLPLATAEFRRAADDGQNRVRRAHVNEGGRAAVDAGQRDREWHHGSSMPAARADGGGSGGGGGDLEPGQAAAADLDLFRTGRHAVEGPGGAPI